MPESLFIRRPPKRLRVVLTMLASLGLHGSIVAVAQWWPQATPPVDQPLGEVTFFEPPHGPDPLPSGNVDPLPNQPTPATEERPVPDDTPPPPDVPEMPDPEQTPPPRKKVSLTRPASPPAPNARHESVASAGQGARNPNGTNPTGASGGSRLGWFTPKPAYPFQARASHLQGTTTISVTTDATGRVISAVVVQSAGNAMLDATSTNFARANWQGPPNSQKIVEFVYEMH